MASSTWRKIFLIKYNDLHRKKKKIVFDRSSAIPTTFLFNKIKIHNGSKLKSCYVTKWMIGFKFGEFTLNRKMAVYKAKQLRKKRLKLLKQQNKVKR